MVAPIMSSEQLVSVDPELQSFRLPTRGSGGSRRHHSQSEHKLLSLMKEDRHGLALLPFSLRLARTPVVPVIPAPLDLLMPAMTFARPARARGQFLTLLSGRTGNR